MYQKQRNGFSLIELLLVISIIIALALTSLSRYQKYKVEHAISTLKENVTLLQYNLNKCYADPKVVTMPECEAKAIDVKNCQFITSAKDELNFTDLVADKDDYTPEILKGIEVAPPTKNPCPGKYYIHKFKVTVALKDKATDWYLNRLDATGYKNKDIYWERMPSYTLPGMHNDLWILGASLATFKKQKQLKATT